MILRHDVDEARSLALGQRYADVLCGMPPGGGEGTLISPFWVLTAAHVAADLSPGDIIEVAGREIAVRGIVAHPASRDEWEENDLALVRLAEPVPRYTPVELYPPGDEAGVLTIFVGRGDYGTGLTGPVGNDRRVRGATNHIERAEGGLLYYSFQGPGEDGVTDLEGISGGGDSGGPALLERGGRLWIVGVSSGQDDRGSGGREGCYGVTEIYVRVSAHVEWVRTQISGA